MMKSAIAILVMAAGFSGVLAAPAALPEAAPVAADYSNYGSYENVDVPAQAGKYDSYGSYQGTDQPATYASYGSYNGADAGKYDTYGTYKRDSEAEE